MAQATLRDQIRNDQQRYQALSKQEKDSASREIKFANAKSVGLTFKSQSKSR